MTQPSIYLLPRIRSLAVIAVVILLAFYTRQSAAVDPLYRSPWNQSRRTKTTTTRQQTSSESSSSINDWIPASSSSSSSLSATTTSTTYYRSSHRHRRSIGNGKDYSSKYLDLDDFKRDKRSRLWQVDLTSRRPGRTASWTTRLVVANCICFALQAFFPAMTRAGVKLSDKILRGEELYRLVTPVFLHGSIAHLFMNMVSLRRVGPDVEKLFGSGRYLTTYLGAGIAGNLLSSIYSPNPALGASGAVFGVIGAQFVFLARNDWLLGRQGKNYQDSIIQTIGMNLVIGAMMPMIDNWGHLGGLIGGAAAAYYFGPRLHLLELPEGGRVLVDKPIIRLPRSIESIPEKVANRFRRMTRRIQVNQHTSDLQDKPWRRQPDIQRNRRDAPNRSIKPRAFD